MQRILSLTLLLFIATQPLRAQLATGDDPLGRPYAPIIGILKSEVAPGVPKKVGELISIAFSNGVKGIGAGGKTMPYQVVDKERLSIAVLELKRGKSLESLRSGSLWDDVVGVQYLLRLEINSFEMSIDPDSIFDEKHKFVRVDNYQIASANLTARLVDVATSKVLLFNNFDAGGTTRGYEEYKTQSDSARALIRLNLQVRDFGAGMLKNVVAGAAAITGIHKENKERAEEVTLTRTVATAPMTVENLNVYAIYKTYTIDGQSFRDVELVGAVNKGKGFDYNVNNFRVVNGEKRIAELFKAGTPMICVYGGFPVGPFMPSEARVGITFQDFKNSSPASPRMVRILQDCFVELAASRPLLLDAVDRELYDLVKKERELQQKTRSDATQAGISIGSSYLLNTELVSFASGREVKFRIVTEVSKVPASSPAPATPAAPATKSKSDKIPDSTGDSAKKSKIQTDSPAAAPGKPSLAATSKTTEKRVPQSFEFSTSAKLNVSLVSIATGEIVYTNAYTLSGEASIPYSLDRFEQSRGQEQSFRNLTGNVTRFLWSDIQKFITPAFHVLNVVESGKNGAETILISGGQRSGFFDGMRVEIVEVVQEDVDGQKMDRDVVLGEVKITDLRPETSLCKVKSGSKEIQAKVGTKARIYCRWAK